MANHTVGDHVLVAADVDFIVDDGGLVGVRFTTDSGSATLVIPMEHILQDYGPVDDWEVLDDGYEYYETEH